MSAILRGNNSKNNNFTILDSHIYDMKFHINTDPADLIPTLDAIDSQMLEAEEQYQFEIIQLKADSPNCTFSTWSLCNISYVKKSFVSIAIANKKFFHYACATLNSIC